MTIVFIDFEQVVEVFPNSEFCQTSKMELFAETVNITEPLNIFTKKFSLDVWQGFECASGGAYTRSKD